MYIVKKNSIEVLFFISVITLSVLKYFDVNFASITLMVVITLFSIYLFLVIPLMNYITAKDKKLKGLLFDFIRYYFLGLDIVLIYLEFMSWLTNMGVILLILSIFLTGLMLLKSKNDKSYFYLGIIIFIVSILAILNHYILN